jgi:hypothetical protein
MEQKASPSLLADEIQAFQDQLLPTVPEETMDILINELQQLINCGIAEKAIKLGDSFPNFRLPNANNETRSFSDFLANGPLVISFYRGACVHTATWKLKPYSNGCLKLTLPVAN